MGNVSAQEDLDRTMKQMLRLSVLMSTVISQQHRLFNHYFIIITLHYSDNI